MAPHQIISLEDLPGPQSFALPDHYDHVHVGYYPDYGATSPTGYTQTLKPEQWQRLIKRLGQIQNPQVAATPSGYALKHGGSGSGGSSGKQGGGKQGNRKSGD